MHPWKLPILCTKFSQLQIYVYEIVRRKIVKFKRSQHFSVLVFDEDPVFTSFLRHVELIFESIQIVLLDFSTRVVLLILTHNLCCSKPTALTNIEKILWKIRNKTENDEIQLDFYKREKFHDFFRKRNAIRCIFWIIAFSIY